MISIYGSIIDFDTFTNKHQLAGLKRKIIEILYSSREVYRYDSENQLLFELSLRKNIIDASLALYRSRFSFKVFRKSVCNEDYWIRTEEGGFLLKDNAAPYDAIRDIYTNSFRYGTECSTAIVIIYYGALANLFPSGLFNDFFPKIYLMNWQHLDNRLGVTHQRKVIDYLPGDCRYFKNPDVDPLTPEWQGENAIDLGDGTYYGHGIGIKTVDGIIEALNRHRKEGSETPAYLVDSATRLNMRYLANVYNSTVLPVQAGI
ncbi:MAG: protein-glutamine gamma-glutamyltransferase [Clostridia bacterium]|nr:protein-glutamine gamma-glutamyltransferase [Clostridia bacterium]